jgi:DNA-binding NarL/FixJ family response regulator
MEKIKVLIVDDHQIVRDGIKSILADEEDIELIGSIESASEALEFIECSLPNVVIADLSMPNMSGIEFTEKLSNLFPSIQVLILSMFSNEEYITQAIQAGAKGYLPKQDSTTELLLEAIRAVYNGDEYFSPSVSKVVMQNFVRNAKHSKNSDAISKNQLTQREMEILKMYVEGFTNSEISANLNLSIYTVKTHKNNIMQKYNFKSTVEMIKFAIKNNIVEL